MSERTQERIVESAEGIFAEKGFAAMTLREVTERAGVNLAAVNYHFGSKEGLVTEIFRRRIEPINRGRMELLEAKLEETKGEPLSLRSLYEVMLMPLAEALMPEGCFDELFLGIITQSLVEPSEFLQQAHHNFVKDIAERFGLELRRSLRIPGMSEEEMAWRMYFSLSTILGALIQHKRIGTCFPTIPDATDVKGFTRHLIRYICGGMEAEAEAAERKASCE